MDATLRRAAILHGVEPGAARALTRRLQRVDFPRGHAVFTEGEPGDRLYIILAGMVKITCGAANGRQAVLAILGPSDMFGELSVFDPGPRSSSAVTLTKVRAVTMHRAALRAWIVDRPQIREQLLTVLARRLRRTNEDLCALIGSDVSGRVAKQLLALAHRFGRADGDRLIVRDLTQEDLAGLVGSTRTSVNRALVEFAERGWIRAEAKTFVILDVDRLADKAISAAAVIRCVAPYGTPEDQPGCERDRASTVTSGGLGARYAEPSAVKAANTTSAAAQHDRMEAPEP